MLAYARRGGSPFALAILNAGGLPPMTGFMIKLRALFTVRAYITVLLLIGRGAALVSYVRLFLRTRMRCRTPPLPILVVISLGSV